MPIIKSAKKRMRQNEQMRERNKALKSFMKNLKKKTFAVIENEQSKPEDVINAINLYKSQVDKAWAKNIFKRNKASRLKSNIDHMLAKKLSASK